MVLRPFDEDADFAEAMLRFSRWRSSPSRRWFVTGILQSVRELGSRTALVDTVYGAAAHAKLTSSWSSSVPPGSPGVVQSGWVSPGARGRRTRVTAHAFAATAEGPADLARTSR